MRRVHGNRKRNSLLFCMAVFILGLSSCGSIEIESKWRGGEITVDGRGDDWKGLLWSIEDSGVFVGVLNDDQHLYLCLQSADRRAAEQVLRQGLTIWFNPKGKKGKSLGIHYPLGQEPDDFGGRLGRRPGGRPEEKEPEEKEPDEGELGREEPPEREPMMNNDEVEILGPGRDEKAKMRLDELKGIEASIGRASGILVYELKVPLANGPDAPYAAGTRPGSYLGISLDSKRLDMVGPMMGGGGRIPAGGRPGMGGRFPGGGRMMGGRGGRGFDLPERLKLRLKVHLASPPL